MAQVPPIDDSYIDDIIKSAGPFDPTLTTTQGIKLRELFKQIRDRIEQGNAVPPFNPTAGPGVILSGTYPNIQIGVDVGRGPNQIVSKNENADLIVGRVAIIGADGAAGDDLSVGATVQLSNTSTVFASRGARMQLGDDGDIVFKTFTGPGDGTGSWFNRIRIKNAGGTLDYSEDLSARYNARSLVDKAYVDSKIGGGGGGSNNYLPLSGGTLTGDLNGKNATFSNSVTAGAGFLNSVTIQNLQLNNSANGNPGIVLSSTGSTAPGGYTSGQIALLMRTNDGVTNYQATISPSSSGNSSLTLPIGVGTLALASDFTAYGKLSGGNTWTGNQIVNGTVTATSFVQSSERALKDNVQPYTDQALDKVNAIEISSFTYKSDEEKNFKVGFIADDTDSLFSTKDKNTMDIGTTLAVSLKAIQELSAEIKQLKERLTGHENIN